MGQDRAARHLTLASSHSSIFLWLSFWSDARRLCMALLLQGGRWTNASQFTTDVCNLVQMNVSNGEVEKRPLDSQGMLSSFV